MSPIEIGMMGVTVQMRGIIKPSYFFALLMLICLVPFQNCAIHQSDARKYLEKYGLSSTSGAVVDCYPYILGNEAAIAFSTPSPMKLSFAKQGNNYQCLISIDNSSTAGVDTAVCTIGPDIKTIALGVNSVQNTETLSMGSVSFTGYAYATVATPARVSIVGAFTNAQAGGEAPDGAKCDFVLSSTELAANKSTALARGVRLVDTILRHQSLK